MKLGYQKAKKKVIEVSFLIFFKWWEIIIPNTMLS
jgi:hypothetical protein